MARTVVRTLSDLRAGPAAADAGVALSASVELQFRYSYDEFMSHVRAMKTVRNWHDTQRFGHLGPSQDSHANAARVVEYFSDSYPDQKEALAKAELFLCIYDYLARNAVFFGRKGLLEQVELGLLEADPALLRAVHFAFSLGTAPERINPKKIMNLARCFQDLAPPA
jgi:hypothetical protein